MKGFANMIILLLATTAVWWVVSKYGSSPTELPIVRVSVTTNQCLSVLVVEKGEEQNVECDFFKELKRTHKPYITQYEGPEDWSQEDRKQIG